MNVGERMNGERMMNGADFLRACTGFPPCVVGAVSDVATWEAVTAPGAELRCGAVELRVDALPTVLPEGALERSCVRPLLLTIRHHSEGGMQPLPEEVRLSLAFRLLPRASALDWEIAHLAQARELVQEAHALGVAVVASAHDFERTPSLASLREKESLARSLGADVVKFAFRLRCAEDMMTGVELLRQASGPLAVMGMGPLGPVSRLLYAQLGTALVYGYLGEAPTAPGQWSADRCSEVLEGLTPGER